MGSKGENHWCQTSGFCGANASNISSSLILSLQIILQPVFGTLNVESSTDYHRVETAASGESCRCHCFCGHRQRPRQRHRHYHYACLNHKPWFKTIFFVLTLK